MVVLGERVPDRGSVETWKLPAVPAPRVTPMSVAVPVGLAVIGLLTLGPLWRGAIMTSAIGIDVAPRWRGVGVTHRVGHTRGRGICGLGAAIMVA